jgi:formylglycine-generating enzyme required for sulfatase activity
MLHWEARWQPALDRRTNHPVVCVTWDEAQDYASWISQKTGHHYRLLSEAEYEYINRAGSTSAFFWGSTWGSSQANGNYDRDETTAVGSFKPNGLGLYDTTGNVDSWTLDCWHDSYIGAPTDGNAWTTGGDCDRRVVRGGSWGDRSFDLRAAHRNWSSGSNSEVGLRLARSND